MTAASAGGGPLAGFHPAVRAWFERALGRPTPAQEMGWPPISRGENTLILAPTGSGKTLAAFLHCLNRLYLRSLIGGAPAPVHGVRVLYVSPLRALNNDIHRNLEVPLAGINAAAAGMGSPLPLLRSAVRTGDTPPDERRRMVRNPPDILITTPESLFLMLCGRSREILRTVETVIVDEIHALFPNKRGAQLSLALELLDELAGGEIQRIGLSATQRPLQEIAAFLGGGLPSRPAEEGAGAEGADGSSQGAAPGWRPRPVTVVEAGGRRPVDLLVQLPVRDLSELPEHSVWPEMHRAVWALVQEHRSTLVFVNSRQVGERVAAALNDLAGEEICRVHHGSISREARLETERQLKAGQLRCLVATSSLELGIDIGAIDLVVQVESPHEVARGLQRVGRAAHVPGLPGKGRILPKTRQDLLEATVVSREMLAGRIERHKAQSNALDVLAQFVVGATTGDVRPADEMLELTRRSYNYRGLPGGQFEAVLGMVSGLHDTGEYMGLRPLVYWDRVNRTLTATERGRRLVFSSGGTIPDTGSFGVVLEGAGVKLGELDEEFVYERRLGDRFTLGTSAWRIVEFRHDRVVVTPASGGPRAPFWKGDALGRSPDLGLAIGGFLAEAEEALGREGPTGAPRPDAFWETLRDEAALEPDGVENLKELLVSQRAATGRLPSNQALVIEEFRDELGQWRVVIHSFFGRRVNEPLALLLSEDLESNFGRRPDVVVTDDGLMVGWTASEEPPPIDLSRLAGPDLAARVARLFRATPLFGLLFRQAAGRALVLPRAPYGRKRTPLWLSRRKAAGLLAVAERFDGFPLVTEAYREGLSTVFDLDGLGRLLDGLAGGAVTPVRVRREVPSPFSRPMLFAASGAFMYGDDLPAAERRVRYLGLDPDSLSQLLGQAPLRELLDPAAIAEARLRASPEGLAARPPADPDELHVWLARYGELDPRSVPDAARDGMQSLGAAGRARLFQWTAGSERRTVWVAAEDEAAYSRALSDCGGVDPAGRLQAREELLARFARRRTPFTATEAAAWYGFPEPDVTATLERLSERGILRRGAFMPGGEGEEWADVLILEEMHRRSLARARRAIEPVPPAQYVLFLQAWQGVCPSAPVPGTAPAAVRSRVAGPASLAQVLKRLAGVRLPAESWESTVLPLRLPGYSPADLDVLLATGRFRWIGAGTVDDLSVAFWPGERAPQDRAGTAGHTVRTPAGGEPGGLPPERGRRLNRVESGLLETLRSRGALFLPGLWQSSDARPGEVLAALEDLLAAGEVTNDSFGPIRQLLSLGTRYRSLARQVTPAVLDSTGRWSLVGAPPSPGAEELCDLLLGRYGLLSREIAVAEGIVWGELLHTLVRREVLGQVRRGYFVRGLSGMQFALPQAVEALRDAAGGEEDISALPGSDPAQAWGRILHWPEDRHLARQPVVLAVEGGRPVLSGEGRPLRLTPLEDLSLRQLAAALRELSRVAAMVRGAGGRIEIASYDGRPVLGGEVEDLLKDAGFIRGPLTMIRWLGPVVPPAGF